MAHEPALRKAKRVPALTAADTSVPTQGSDHGGWCEIFGLALGCHHAHPSGRTGVSRCSDLPKSRVLTTIFWIRLQWARGEPLLGGRLGLGGALGDVSAGKALEVVRPVPGNRAPYRTSFSTPSPESNRGASWHRMGRYSGVWLRVQGNRDDRKPGEHSMHARGGGVFGCHAGRGDLRPGGQRL